VLKLSLPRIHRSVADRVKKSSPDANKLFLPGRDLHLSGKKRKSQCIGSFFACVPSGVVRVQAVVGGGSAGLRASVVELARFHHALALPVHLFPEGGRLHANQHWKVGGTIILEKNIKTPVFTSTFCVLISHRLN